jgi:hypothetical protein
MMKPMKRSRQRRRAGRAWIVTLACLLPLAGLPGAAAAQDLDVETDSRLEGYGDKVAMEPTGSTVVWLGFVFCSVVALLGLFKDAKRSHLD